MLRWLILFRRPEQWGKAAFATVPVLLVGYLVLWHGCGIDCTPRTLWEDWSARGGWVDVAIGGGNHCAVDEAGEVTSPYPGNTHAP